MDMPIWPLHYGPTKEHYKLNVFCYYVLLDIKQQDIQPSSLTDDARAGYTLSTNRTVYILKNKKFRRVDDINVINNSDVMLNSITKRNFIFVRSRQVTYLYHYIYNVHTKLFIVCSTNLPMK